MNAVPGITEQPSRADRRVALVSIPKSGTNLVLAILQRALPEAKTVDLMYPEPFRNGESRRDYAFRANIAARKLIKETPAPVIFHTHATFSDYLMTTLWEFGVKTIFLMCDPRAVAVSFVDYVLKNEQHPAHRYFRHQLPDFESRLRTAIMGTDPDDPSQPFVPRSEEHT
ncbi:MAG: sulfotransferase domain-containing protein, partial [Phycisphaerales bacterium JB038]